MFTDTDFKESVVKYVEVVSILYNEQVSGNVKITEK